jgi:Uma2 family endonuclease
MSTVSRPRSRTRRTTIGPADHGRRMSFERFIRCDFQEGWLYELARGVIVVTNVPGRRHGRIVNQVARLFHLYDVANPGLIQYQGGGMESRIRAPGMQSDRHPDQAIYLDPEPDEDDSSAWTYYIPTLAVEVVSHGSKKRDYVEKAEEYLRIGVREYWILDPDRRQMLVHRRAGDTWVKQPIAVGKTYRTPLLPGLIVRPSELLGLAPERGR